MRLFGLFLLALALALGTAQAALGPHHIDAALEAAQALLARDGHLLTAGAGAQMPRFREVPVKPPTPPAPGATVSVGSGAHIPIEPASQGELVMVPSSMSGVPDASGLVLPGIVPSGPVIPESPQEATKLKVDPKPLVTPIIAIPEVKVPVPEPSEKPFKADEGWAAAAMAERRNPSDHLIQQTIAGIKRVESKDVGELAPGLKLGYEHSYTNKGLLEAKVERPSLEDKRGGVDDGLKYLGVDRARLGEDGPKKQIVANALKKMGHVVNDLAKRVAQVDQLEEKLMGKVMNNKQGSGTEDAKEQEMVHERAESHRLKRETEVAELVRNEVQVLTDQLHTELRVLKTKFFAELKDNLHGLRANLQAEFLRQKEHDEKLERIAEGKFKSATRTSLDEENIASPARMKARLNLDISRRINEAFNRMASIRKEIVTKNLNAGAQGEHTAPETRAEETAAMLKARGGEPSTEEVKAALEKAAEQARKEAAKDTNPRKTAADDGEAAEEIGDAAAEALKLDQLEERTEAQATDEQKDNDAAIHDKERNLIGELASLRAEDHAEEAEEAANKMERGENEEMAQAKDAEVTLDQMEKQKVKEEMKNLEKSSFLQEQDDAEREDIGSPQSIAEQLRRMWLRRTH